MTKNCLFNNVYSLVYFCVLSCTLGKGMCLCTHPPIYRGCTQYTTRCTIHCTHLIKTGGTPASFIRQTVVTSSKNFFHPKISEI